MSIAEWKSPLVANRPGEIQMSAIKLPGGIAASFPHRGHFG